MIIHQLFRIILNRNLIPIFGYRLFKNNGRAVFFALPHVWYLPMTWLPPTAAVRWMNKQEYAQAREISAIMSGAVSLSSGALRPSACYFQIQEMLCLSLFCINNIIKLICRCFRRAMSACWFQEAPQAVSCLSCVCCIRHILSGMRPRQFSFPFLLFSLTDAINMKAADCFDSAGLKKASHTRCPFLWLDFCFGACTGPCLRRAPHRASFMKGYRSPS